MPEEINIQSDSRTIQDDIIEAYRAARDEAVRLETILKFGLGNWYSASKNFSASFDRLHKDTQYNRSMIDKEITADVKKWLAKSWRHMNSIDSLKEIEIGLQLFDEYHKALDSAALLPITRKG